MRAGFRVNKSAANQGFSPKDAVAASVFEVLERRHDWSFPQLEKALFAEVFLRLKSDVGSVPLLG
jgi:hypothetical protein